MFQMGVKQRERKRERERERERERREGIMVFYISFFLTIGVIRSMH